MRSPDRSGPLILWKGLSVPIGSFAAVPSLVQTLLQLHPRSVLDLGLGFGGNGAAVREWLDLGVTPWRTHLVGVECWMDYRNPVWDLYNVIHAQTIEQFLAGNHELFECVLFTEVLEHFDKPAGKKILDDLRRHVAPAGSLIITSPAQFFPQGAAYGNERERHRSYWSFAELRDWGFTVDRVGSDRLMCGECWFARWQR